LRSKFDLKIDANAQKYINIFNSTLMGNKYAEKAPAAKIIIITVKDK
tara:strand:+ start:201 stop:341 length:141 start_codon:yes stop_codon:yes gene_type:complete